MNKKFMNRGCAILFANVLVFTILSCQKGEKIEEIAGHAVYTKEYEKAYEAAVSFSKYLVGDDIEALYKTVCNPSLASSPETYQIASGLRPEIHYNQYRDLIMISQVAKQKGFLDDPEVQSILEFNRLQTIAQLYLGKRIQTKEYKVSEQEKTEACKELRSKEPKRMAGLSATECLEVGERFVRRQLMQYQSGLIEDEIKEQANVKKNSKFNREEFLNNLELYKKIQKEGGCLEEEAITSESENSSSDIEVDNEQDNDQE